MEKSRFESLGLSPWINRQLASVNIKQPMPVQENVIPQILQGKDVIGVAKTGSGKTLAFVLPILHRLSENPYGIFAVVATPTRELAYQISECFSVIGKAIGLRQVVSVGGMDMMKQGIELSKRPHVVIATPGRLADHLNSCDTFHFKRAKFLVIDEADKLLGGPYDEEMKYLFNAMPYTKQTLLFSATMTDTLDKVKKVAQKEVFMWCEDNAVKTVDGLKQYYILCPSPIRDGFLVEALRQYLAENPNSLVIIFADTCKNCQILSQVLKIIGFDNVALHKMMPQKDRLASLAQFKSNVIKLLVATDVASRGLDIPEVELVMNYTVPIQTKDYIHRVGRTARAGRQGIAMTLVTPEDLQLLQAVESAINTKLTNFKVVARDVANIFTHISVTRREVELKLKENVMYERKAINKRKQDILDGKDPDKELKDRIIKKLIQKDKKKRIKKDQKFKT